MNNNINNINNTLQDIDNRIVYLLDKLSAVENGGNTNSTNLNQTIKDLELLKTTVTNLQNTVNTINSTITTNTNNIEELKFNVNENSEKIQINTNKLEEHSNSINSLQVITNQLENSLQALQTVVNEIETNLNITNELANTNSANIATINESINNIKIQIEQILSSGGGSGGSSEDLTQLTNQVNEMQKIVDNFTTLIKDRNAIFNTPYYGIDQNVVVQTYDYIINNYNFSGVGTHKPAFVSFYCHESTTTATLKITLKIKGVSDGGTGQLSLYMNGDNLTQTADFSYDSEIKDCEMIFDLAISQPGNFFYYTVASTNKVSFEFSQAKCELFNCTNPLFFNRACPYDVICYNNTYYITNCTGPTAKYCAIDVNNISSINDLSWTDTGIEAQQMVVTAKLDNSVTAPFPISHISYGYLRKDGKLYFQNTYANKSSVTSEYFIAPRISLGHCNASVGQIAISCYYNSNIQKTLFGYSTSGSATNSAIGKDLTNAFHMVLKSQFKEYKTNYQYRPYAIQQLDGQVIMHASSGATLNLGFGYLVGAYYSNESYNQYNIYVKVFNQIVKYHIIYTPAISDLTLESSEVIGNYENYFEGVNNDYFVIKNNKLHYYKNTLQDIVE